MSDPREILKHVQQKQVEFSDGSKKRTFELLYAKDLGDSRIVTEDMLNQIANGDTKGSKYPVSKGHLSAIGFGGDDIPAAGTVSNLRMFNGSLLGDVVLTDSVSVEYEAGTWPAWSAGIKRDFTVVDGAKVPGDWKFGHLALLGSHEAAFKDLQDLSGLNFSDNTNSDVVAFSTEDQDYIMLAVASENNGSPPDVVSTQLEAGTKNNTNNEDEMEKQELEMMLAAANEEKSAMQAKLDALISERQESARLGFSTASESAVDKLKSLGVSEESRESFSAELAKFADLAAEGTSFVGLFAALDKVLGEVRPKVTPGNSAKNEEPKSDYVGSREATQALFGKLGDE